MLVLEPPKASSDIERFPPLPAAALHILRLSERQAVGVDELAEVVAGDEAMASAVLRAINSNFYGLRRKVTNVRQAVALLGLQSVQTLVLGIALRAAAPKRDEGGLDLAAYWKRCVYAAAAARALASRFLPGCVEGCFTAALLMDVGTLWMDRVYGPAYASICNRCATHVELMALERLHFHTDHAEAAVKMIRQWGLPESLEVPIRTHHAPQKVENMRLRSVAEVLDLSSKCAEVFLCPRPAEAILAARDALAERHATGVAEADKLLVRIGQKAAELAPLLRVMVEATDFGALLENATPRLLEIALGRRDARSANQRRSPRHAREGTLSLFPCLRGTLGREVHVKLRDLSGNGIGLFHSRSMPRGSQFVVHLPQPGGGNKSLLYTTVRCTPSGGGYIVGAELRAVLNTGAPNDAAEEDDQTGHWGAD